MYRSCVVGECVGAGLYNQHYFLLVVVLQREVSLMMDEAFTTYVNTDKYLECCWRLLMWQLLFLLQDS